MDSKEHDHTENNSAEPSKGVTSYDLGIGRLYECVFCKRGFTTAQALGGHMNIHRKDRTKPKLIPCPSSSSNHKRFLIDAPQSGFLSPCCKENQCSGSSGTHSTGILSSHNPVQEIGTIKLSPVGFNKHHHHVVEEVDLELRLGHHSL